MSHLGERLTALVDGELGHDERDRALAHLAACAECRAEADLLRRLKGRLRGLGGTTPPTELVGRLRAMGDLSCPPPAVRPAPSVGSQRPGDTRPRGRAGAAAGRRRVPRARYVLAGAATLVVVGVGGAAFAAGGDQGRLPQVSPSMQQFAVEHALTSGDMPVRVTDPASPDLTTNGAARP